MKIKLSKSRWEEAGKKAGWIKEAVIPGDGYADGGEPYTDEEMDLMEKQENVIAPKTHREIAVPQRLARPCHPDDLILVDEGLQCGNCLALTRDHGRTWESPKK